MPFKEETLTATVGGDSITFKANNRRRTSQGIKYMRDAEFTAHKAEQVTAAEDQIRREAADSTKKTRLAALRTKIENDTATAGEMREYVRLRDF